MTAFRKAFANTMKHEGGYSNDPNDPGGETYMGISRRYWPSWKGWAVIDQLLAEGKTLSLSEELPDLVRKFYRDQFWNRFMGDEVAIRSKAVAIELFDTSVNHGIHAAVRYLQESLNLLNINQRIYKDIVVDGKLGYITLATLTSFFTSTSMSITEKERMLLNVMNALQGSHYIELMRKYPEKELFRGWFTRI